jgi:hypothetical protein
MKCWAVTGTTMTLSASPDEAPRRTTARRCLPLPLQNVVSGSVRRQ